MGSYRRAIALPFSRKFSPSGFSLKKGHPPPGNVRFTDDMKIGNPIKNRVKVSERQGRFIVTGDGLEIVVPTLRTARRLGVTLRRAMAEKATTFG
jgi:hypothetical protein